MNPFAYFGGYGVTRLYNCEGFGLLIVMWWLCHASLTTLVDGSLLRQHKTLIAVFLGVGLVAMLSVERVYDIILERGSRTLPKNLFESISSTAVERRFAIFLGIAAGALLFRILQATKARFSVNSEILPP